MIKELTAAAYEITASINNLGEGWANTAITVHYPSGETTLKQLGHDEAVPLLQAVCTAFNVDWNITRAFRVIIKPDGESVLFVETLHKSREFTADKFSLVNSIIEASEKSNG